MASTLKIVVRIEDDGSRWATVDEMPGVYATGDNAEELRESLEQGISLWLAESDAAAPDVSLGPLRSREAVASADLVYAENDERTQPAPRPRAEGPRALGGCAS